MTIQSTLPKTIWTLLLPLVATTVLATGCAEEPTATESANEHDREHDEHEVDSTTGATDEHAGQGHDEEEGHADEVSLTPEAIEHFGIQVGVAQRVIPNASFTAPARIGFNTEQIAHITSAIEGRVARLWMRLGDQVAAGDVLLTIDSPQLGRLQSEYLAQRTAVATARPVVELARAGYERAKRLYEQNGGVSLAEVQARQAELAAARRDLLTAEADLTAATHVLRSYGMSDEQIEQLAESGDVSPSYQVTAPIAGEVIEREATLGELVGPNDERLMVLADLTEVWALVDVPEVKLGQVDLGTPVMLEIPALPGRVFEGEVTYIAPQIDPAARTARLRVAVDNTENVLRPGMFANATVAVGGGERMLAVPSRAVTTVEGEPSVFVPVPDEPNTFARRPVVVGERVGVFIPGLEGLEEGDRLVIGGTFILKAEAGKSGVEHHH